MKKRKAIILCADDFGLNTNVSKSLLALASLKRLSAVSCMVNKKAFKVFAPDLLDLKPELQIGLHFNLTEGPLLSNGNLTFNLSKLLFKTHLGLINEANIEKEFNAQLDVFTDVIGSLPDFIDGHQHVHQLPGIRKIILKIVEQRLSKITYIRSTYPAILLNSFRFKTQVLAWTGGQGLHRELNRLAIPHNTYFAGIYDFASNTNYRSLFRQWLSLASNNTLIMCHPASESPSTSDAIAQARTLEMNYFTSDDFLRDCQEFQVSL